MYALFWRTVEVSYSTFTVQISYRLYKTQGSCVIKVIFYHNYWVNYFKGQIENWVVDRFTIIGVPFGGVKKNREKDH